MGHNAAVTEEQTMLVSAPTSAERTVYEGQSTHKSAEFLISPIVAELRRRNWFNSPICFIQNKKALASVANIAEIFNDVLNFNVTSASRQL